VITRSIVQSTDLQDARPAMQGLEKTSRNTSSSEGKSKKKIFYIVDSFQVGGTELQAVEIAIRMHRIGYNVTVGVLSMKGPLGDRLQKGGVPIVDLCSQRRLFSVWALFHVVGLAYFLRRNQFELVHSHDLWSNLLAIPIARAAGLPVIISRRNLSDQKWFSTWRGLVFRLLQRQATFVLANAAAVRDLLIVREHLPLKKVRVVRNGVECARLSSHPRHRSDALHNLENKKIVILVANMYSEKKGHAHLIDAAPRVLAAVPETCFVLVGDGYLRRQFEQQARDHGLAEAFLFLGRRSDIANLLTYCDVAVLPSLTEALPNSVLEYMSAGLPIIATSVGGIPELITHNHTGILIPPANTDALAIAIVRLLKDPELSGRLGLAARKKAQRKFSFERLISQLDNLYSLSVAG
jgi:glycosyltransferase involved in cell wall biosynthesis